VILHSYLKRTRIRFVPPTNGKTTNKKTWLYRVLWSSLESKVFVHYDNFNNISIKHRYRYRSADIHRLFSRFATKAETAGTCLGLFISKDIMQAHGDKMWAEQS
jgi:light-regulated signal transduction histidine kinase (bacteriophytochrome)